MAQEQAGSNLSVQDYLELVIRRRWIIASFFVVCMLVTTLGTFTMKPVYEAMTTILIEGENVDLLRAEAASTSDVSTEVFENYLSTQIALIRSRKIAGKVFDDLELSKLDDYAPSGKSRLPNFARFADDIEIKRVTATRMVTISIENNDPALAAQIVNRLAEVYAQDNLMRRALTFIRNQRMASINSEYMRLQTNLATLSTRYGPKHPAMIEIKKEIGSIANKIRMQETGKSGSEEVSVDEQLLEGTLQQIQEGSVLSSSRMNNIVVVDAAVVPDVPVKPKKKLNLALGFVVGLMGGLLVAFVIDLMDNTFKNSADLKLVLKDVHFLGSVYHENIKGEGQTKNTYIDRVIHTQPMSASAEVYRLLLTSLLWFAKRDGMVKDLAVLSSIAGEGKSTIASNLAIGLAQVGHRVLLVDTDLRKGRLHESYALDNNRGLGNYLTEDLPLEKIIQATDIPQVSIVPCGKSGITSSVLIRSEKMSQFIREVRNRFDMIVYDTPPLTLIADAGILMTQIQSAVLTTRIGVTNSEVLKKSLEIVKESNVKLVGTILNDDRYRESRYYSEYYRNR